MQLFVIFMPTYMNKVLGLSLKTASILAALPPLTQLFVKLVAAALSDRFHFSSKISLTRQLRLFNTVSSLLGGLLLFILALIPTIELLWSILLLTLASSALGFNTSGVFRSTPLVAKQHAYFVTGVIQFVYCFVLLSMPFGIEALTVKRPKKDWSMVFVTLAFLLTFTNLVFCVFGKGTAASWTKSANCKERNSVTPTEMQQQEVREFAHSANV
jgi:nitrate/nitrite transporter NarK